MGDRIDDPDDQIDALIEGDVLKERADGTVVTTEAFEHRRGIYLDSYTDLSDDRFESVVGSAFDLSAEEASDRIEEFGVTREQLATYLALDGHLDDGAIDRETLAAMSAIVMEVQPPSPVPDGLDDVTDDHEAYIDEHGDAVVFVFRRECDPCKAMTEELDDIRAAAPDGVPFAGVDGSAAHELRRAFTIDVAPTTLLFADGDLASSLEGRQSVDRLAEAFADVYG